MTEGSNSPDSKLSEGGFSSAVFRSIPAQK